MQHLTRQILISCLLLVSHGPVAGSEEELIFRAYYKIYSGTLEIGESTRTLKRIDETKYSFESDTHATGLARMLVDRQVLEQSLIEVKDNRIIPIEYSYRKYDGELKKEVKSLFDWKTSLVRNSVNNMEKDKHSQIDLPLSDGMLDKLLYQYAIMRDLQNGISPVEYLIADTRKIKTYTFENAGLETIETPGGTMNAVKLLRYNKNDSDNEKVIIWCASNYNYLPVKIETTHEDGSIITAMIHKLDGQL